jgi:hypothetical protein
MNKKRVISNTIILSVITVIYIFFSGMELKLLTDYEYPYNYFFMIIVIIALVIIYLLTSITMDKYFDKKAHH